MTHAHPDDNRRYDMRHEVLGDRLARLRRSQGLSKTDLIGRMRAEIAHAAGTTPSKVRITIEM